MTAMTTRKASDESTGAAEDLSDLNRRIAEEAAAATTAEARSAASGLAPVTTADAPTA